MMIKGFKSIALAAVLLASALGAAVPAHADDLAERRRLADELILIVPYGEADAERDAVDGVLAQVRKAYGERATPYALEQAKVAALEAWGKQPSIQVVIRNVLETRMTTDELREAIAFTRSPVAVKSRTQPPQGATESDEDYIARLFTPQEFQEFLALITRPAIMKYMTLLKEAAEPLGVTFGADLGARLQARCAGRTGPLPWCT